MTNSSNHLALLIAAPQLGDEAMSRDQAAMAQALLGRGFAVNEILSLHGRLDRPLVIAFLHAASRRVAGWSEGSVFLHVSSHGFFTGEAATEARPGLWFASTDDVTDDNHLFWEELFATLVLPRRVRLTLLPDL